MLLWTDLVLSLLSPNFISARCVARSSGSLEFLDGRSVLHFTGNIDINGGGFSSVRKSINPVDLS